MPTSTIRRLHARAPKSLPRVPAALACLGPLAGAPAVHAGTVLDRIQSGGTLKVCIWPDYDGITWRNPRTQQLSGIDKPGVKVAVQAGTFMEPVMAAALKQASMVVVKPPQTREQELEAGRVDVFMTDFPVACWRQPRSMAWAGSWCASSAPART